MREAWSRALKRANARKIVAKQAKATQAGADPGELKSDKAFMSGMISGRITSPLSQVRRECHYPT